MIAYSATLNTASGAGLSSYTEILGAGAGTGCQTRSQAAQTSQSDIDAGSGATRGMTWVNHLEPMTDNSVGWVDGSDVGIYIAHTQANTASDGGADAVLQLTVEYTGVT